MHALRSVRIHSVRWQAQALIFFLVCVVLHGLLPEYKSESMLIQRVRLIVSGTKYACDGPQGLGSEQELIKGKPKWMKYPGMPVASLKDLKKARAKLIGTEGTTQICENCSRTNIPITSCCPPSQLGEPTIGTQCRQSLLSLPTHATKTG